MNFVKLYLTLIYPVYWVSPNKSMFTEHIVQANIFGLRCHNVCLSQCETVWHKVFRNTQSSSAIISENTQRPSKEHSDCVVPSEPKKLLLVTRNKTLRKWWKLEIWYVKERPFICMYSTNDVDKGQNDWNSLFILMRLLRPNLHPSGVDWSLQ